MRKKNAMQNKKQQKEKTKWNYKQLKTSLPNPLLTTKAPPPALNFFTPSPSTSKAIPSLFLLTGLIGVKAVKSFECNSFALAGKVYNQFFSSITSKNLCNTSTFFKVDLDPNTINFDLALVRQTLILLQSLSKSPTWSKKKMRELELVREFKKINKMKL